MPDAPTPNNMPGAQAVATAAEPVEQQADNQESSSPEELQAQLEHWKTQARKNEERAKANAKKAKDFDDNAAAWRASHEELQRRIDAEKPPDQRVLDQAAKEREAREAAERDAADARSALLRFQLSDGLPSWALGLVTGTTEDQIREQVATTKANLDAYVQAQGTPRRPAPVQSLGHESTATGTPRDQFAAAMNGIL